MWTIFDNFYLNTIRDSDSNIWQLVNVLDEMNLWRDTVVVVLCQEGARAPCCTRDEGGPFGAVL